MNSQEISESKKVKSTPNSNTTHSIDWGDGSPITTYTGINIPGANHSYPIGLFTISYTVTLENGCSKIKTFNVFIGTSPSASVGTAGTPILCDPSSVVFNIFAGAQNTNGTVYSFQVNDGSPIQNYTHEQLIALGGQFNTVLGQWIFQVTHNFNNVSCNTDSNINGSVYYNSFQASVTVSNPSFRSLGIKVYQASFPHSLGLSQRPSPPTWVALSWVSHAPFFQFNLAETAKLRSLGFLYCSSINELPPSPTPCCNPP